MAKPTPEKTAEYIVQTPLNHNLVDYFPGDVVSLTEEYASILLSGGVVAIKGKAPAPTPAPAEESPTE